jgi:signal transduction histidine kinase
MAAASLAAGKRRGSGWGGRTRHSAFEASAFERSLGSGSSVRWIGWRRRLLVLLALLGCLGLFVLAHWVAAAPEFGARFGANRHGELVLIDSVRPALQGRRGTVLVAVGAASQPALAVDAALLHRSPRWQPSDAARRQQLAQQRALDEQFQGTPAPTAVRLQFADGTVVTDALSTTGYTGIGLLFWPQAGVALLLYLMALVLLLARPQRSTLLFVVIALCQGSNLVFNAIESAGGLGRIATPLAGHMGLRAGLDLCSAAAIVHAFALHPRRLPGAGWIAAAAWSCLPCWLALVWLAGPVWWCAQGGCLVLGAAALAVIARSHRIEPNPYALVMRRFAVLALAGFSLATVAVAATASSPTFGPAVASGVSVGWSLFFAALLVLTPFLARSRLLLREFALLAGVSTLGTAIDLLFVAVFSLGPFTSLAFAVFASLGLYAAARQFLVNRLLGRTLLTTERTFDQIYRAAREVQAQPMRHPRVQARLLRELFDPLELVSADRAPVHSRVLGGGAGLVVPLRSDDEPATAATLPMALVLRFADRGKRLFTRDDAHLADRVVEQLRRALAYDQAVERGRFEERQRIAQDLHDDIGARLLTLMYQAPTPEMEEYIRHTLQDLKTLTRGLAAAEHRLSDAAAEWKADLTQRLNAARVQLGWSVQYDRDLRLSVVQWSALTRVLRELVSNALYHGHAASIDVALQLEAGDLSLRVADDGSGRQPMNWSHGLGLGGVRKRIKLLGGSVQWQENGARGVVCEVRVLGFGRPPDGSLQP